MNNLNILSNAMTIEAAQLWGFMYRHYRLCILIINYYRLFTARAISRPNNVILMSNENQIKKYIFPTP